MGHVGEPEQQENERKVNPERDSAELTDFPGAGLDRAHELLAMARPIPVGEGLGAGAFCPGSKVQLVLTPRVFGKFSLSCDTPVTNRTARWGSLGE